MRFPTQKDLIPVKAEWLFNFKDEVDGLSAFELTVGPNDDPIVHLNDFDKRKLLTTLEELQAFDKRVPKLKFVHWRNNKLLVRDFRKAEIFGHLIQPMANGNYLMSGTYPNHHGRGLVVNDKGRVKAVLDLDFDIEDFQVTASGKIWVRYGDEGCFRGEEHNYSKRIVGCFDANGNHLWPAEPDYKFGPWCTHLNVVSEDCVWYCSLEHALHRVEKFEVTKSTPEREFDLSVFAVLGERLFWAPGSKVPRESLLNVDYLTSTNIDLEDYRFYVPVDSDANPIIPRTHYATRGAKMYFISGIDVYVLDFAKIG